MPKKQLSNDEFLESLRKNPAYSHIDINIEVGKATAWCLANNRENTQRFFVNWINRIQRPLSVPRSNVGRQAPNEVTDPVCPKCGDEYCLKLHREGE